MKQAPEMGEYLSPDSDILPLSWVGTQFYLHARIAIRKAIKSHHARAGTLSSVKVTNVKSAAANIAGAARVPTPSKQGRMKTMFHTMYFVLTK